MVKKKVSFDIDERVLRDVKMMCQLQNMKLSDFFREACLEKLKSEVLYMQIYVPHDGIVEKFLIPKKKYEIDIFVASELMNQNVGAKCEGVIRQISNCIYSQEEEKINQLIKINKGKICFFTKNKVCGNGKENRDK